MQAMFDDGFIQYSENALLLTGALTIKTFTLLINVSLNKLPPTEIGVHRPMTNRLFKCLERSLQPSRPISGKRPTFNKSLVTLSKYCMYISARTFLYVHYRMYIIVCIKKISPFNTTPGREASEPLQTSSLNCTMVNKPKNLPLRLVWLERAFCISNLESTMVQTQNMNTLW